MVAPRWFVIGCTGCLLCWSLGRGDAAQDLGFQVPEGFEVTLYADDSLATDIFSMTIDAQGRVVVAAKGYIKILHDTDGDGRADKATLFADIPKSGTHGMYFDGPDLICDGDKGVRRLYDTDGDGKCDKVSPIWFPTTNDGEHAANGIVRGPDGWYYLITGNDAGITRHHARGPSSLVKEPNAGALVRFSPDGQTQEVLAHGFRNPYDLAFNHLGHVFTVDADGERVHQMPYYAPNRLYDIAPGMHHGWVQRGWMPSWSRPPWWPDSVARLVEIGRGSPTGVTVYRHRAFPERYRQGVFSLCWSFGRVYFFPLTRDGSTYTSHKEIFMRTTGDVGFAPTDMAVGPNGDLFVSIGGRGTRGSVFRVRYKGTTVKPPANSSPLRSVLAADEPFSSWSRARWVHAAKRLGKGAFTAAVLDSRLPLVERIRAVEILTELFGGLTAEAAQQAITDKTDPELTARLLWALTRSTDTPEGRKIITAQTSSHDPRVARAAWEALLTLPSPLAPQTLKPDWQAGLRSADRRVRATALLVARGTGRGNFTQAFPNPPASPWERLAYWWSLELPANQLPLEMFHDCLELANREKLGTLRIEAVRILQLALGDVVTDDKNEKPFVGYIARRTGDLPGDYRRKAAVELARGFPSGNAALDFELSRLLAMLGEDVSGLPERIAARWTAKSQPEDDIHYLLVLSRLPGKRSSAVTGQTALALNGIHGKLAAKNNKVSDQVPSILEAVLERLMELDSGLAAAIVADPSFGLPDHALYANQLPLVEKQMAARKLLAAIAKLDVDQARAAWTPELVRLVSALPDAEALPILRQQFADPRLSDPVALLLAQKRLPEDRSRLIEALSSTQVAVVNGAAEALLRLPNEKAKPAGGEIGKGVRALRRLEVQKADLKTRKLVVALLEHWTGQRLPVRGKEELAPPWLEWFGKTYPRETASLPGLANADLAAWQKRLDRIAWDKGQVARGEVVFQRKNCFRCHGDARRLGPDLAGVAQRFARDDLFTAIIDPNKDISPTYRPTTIITAAGKVHNGLLIYDSPDLTLLQTTPDTTVRIGRNERQLVQPSNISFMPSGLLDDLQDGELADLLAYIKTLGKR